MSKSKPIFIIIDGNALVHRAWHALPPTMQTKKGEIVNAVYGFTVILLKILTDLKPDYLAVSFDLAGPTFRHEQFKDYKATRVKQADELYAQIPRIKEVVEAFNIPIFEKQGFEADDIIGTIVRKPELQKCRVIIATGDMDTLQLVNDHIEVFTMRKGVSDTITYTVEQVKERYDGLTPEQVVDYKALRGDPSDNIPGVKGIGEKGAIELLKLFGTLENIYKNIASKKISERYRKLLTEHHADALLSQKLSRIDDQVSFDFDLEKTRVDGYNINTIIDLFQTLEFKSLLGKIPKNIREQSSLDLEKNHGDKRWDRFDYTVITDDKTFAAFIKQLKAQTIFAVDTETDSLDAFTCKLLGVSISFKKGQAFYIPAQKKWLDELKPILADEKIKKTGHNIKFDLQVLETAGLALNGVAFDSMIASYLINPGSRQHGLDALVFTEFGYQMQPLTELIGTGRKQISPADVPVEKLGKYSCEDADFTLRLMAPLKRQLEARDNMGLLEKMELPLLRVLATMERTGILLDTEFLTVMSKTVDRDLKKIESTIHRLAGRDFNIASPKQLKEILFDVLKIETKGLGKTKTGISTAAGELDKLIDAHEIIRPLIEFRELSKLKSTYLDALPKLVGADGRLHTSYSQTIAATGRLSSSNPNLQNIPVRTQLGQQIRKAFVAPEGFQLLSADYSQIELRIVASLANDKKMISAFEKGEDIHARTAADINNVPLDQVTKEMRYAAKAINFGIIYGQGAWGLSQTAGIPRESAQAFIEKYFLTHPEIKNYLEATKHLAQSKGYTETWFGRRRYFPDINANAPQIRNAAERAAINHPIQGTAADLLKLAMIEIDKKLDSVSPRTNLLLQVHDELVLEVPNDEIEKVGKFVEQEMEAVYKLRAPVEAHLSAGKNWGELNPLA